MARRVRRRENESRRNKEFSSSIAHPISGWPRFSQLCLLALVLRPSIPPKRILLLCVSWKLIKYTDSRLCWASALLSLSLSLPLSLFLYRVCSMLHRSVSVDIAFVRSFCFDPLCFFPLRSVFSFFFILFRMKIELQITRVKLELVNRINRFFRLW